VHSGVPSAQKEMEPESGAGDTVAVKVTCRP
jgi:hypothetical protein